MEVPGKFPLVEKKEQLSSYWGKALSSESLMVKTGGRNAIMFGKKKIHRGEVGPTQHIHCGCYYGSVDLKGDSSRKIVFSKERFTYITLIS